MKEELNSKKILFTFFIMLGLTLLIFGVSYAFFTYQKDGTKSVTMTAGSVKLHYEESSLKSINLTNALPMSDERGKAQTDYFEFTITSETAGYDIPYYVASRVTTSEENKIPTSYISLYLTEVVNNSEVEVLDTTYDTLTNISKNNHIEQQLMLNTVSANTSNYEKTYRLRIWINETADYSPTEVNGVQTYPMQDKAFNFVVNVYTEVEAAPEECVVAANAPEVGDLYCFDTECFRVMSNECSNTILLAEYGIDFEDLAGYFEPTGLQFDPDRPLVSIYEWPDIYDSLEFYAYIYGYPENTEWSSFEEIGFENIDNYDFDSETDTPYPYLSVALTKGSVDQYLHTLKQAPYNVSSAATMRLPSIEEINTIIDNPKFLGLQSHYYWTGSVSEITDDEYYYHNIWIWGREYGTNNNTLDEYDGLNETAQFRPILTIPTASLLSTATKYEIPTGTYIAPHAQTLATMFGIDYDDMNIDYQFINAYTLHAGDKYNAYDATFEDDFYIIDIYSNDVFTEYDNVDGYRKLLSYLESIADDGKLYSDDEEHDLSQLGRYTLGRYRYGNLTINNTKYYYNIYAVKNMKYYHYDRQYSGYYGIELTTEDIWTD